MIFKVLKIPYMLPSLQLLKKVSKEIMLVPNRRKESKREVHFGLFLLGYKSGLRVNEAVSFNLENKTKRGLYRIEKSKGKKERLVYIPKEVIRELKKQNWKPDQTNRFNFYHFLKKIKREININEGMELTPHTLRRAFATHHAEAGMPLPLLQKFLGHSSIRTTALYWRNIYGDDDPSDILAGKKWLEESKKPRPSEPSIKDNFLQLPKNPDSDILKVKPVINDKKPLIELPFIKTETKPLITNYQSQKIISEISPKTSEKLLSDTFANKQPKRLLINNNRNKDKEQFLLTRIKQLEKQLTQVQAKNNHLKLENKHLKTLIRKDHKTEAKILQPLPWKLVK